MLHITVIRIHCIQNLGQHGVKAPSLKTLLPSLLKIIHSVARAAAVQWIEQTTTRVSFLFTNQSYQQLDVLFALPYAWLVLSLFHRQFLPPSVVVLFRAFSQDSLAFSSLLTVIHSVARAAAVQ